MKVYLETSVVLRKLLNQPGIISDWADWDETHTSELTRVEAMRTIDRLRLLGEVGDRDVAQAIQELGEILDGCNIIRLSAPILAAASGGFPVVVAALDAIHLASAMIQREESGAPLIFLTHDRRLGLAAQASGFETKGLL